MRKWQFPLLWVIMDEGSEFISCDYRLWERLCIAFASIHHLQLKTLHDPLEICTII